MSTAQHDGLLLWEAFRDFADDAERCPPAGGEALDRYVAQLRRADQPGSGPKPRSPRRPSLTTMLMRAKTLGLDVVVGLDGTVTFRSSGERAASKPVNDVNEWDEVLTHGKH